MILKICGRHPPLFSEGCAGCLLSHVYNSTRSGYHAVYGIATTEALWAKLQYRLQSGPLKGVGWHRPP